jgi:uncharacterized protein
MNYFVTGASGFIGQHLVRRLISDKRATVFCLVRDESKLPEEIRKRVRVLIGDSTSTELYAQQIRDADVIFHIAARADLGDGDAYRRDNVEFTDAMIRVATQSKKLKRFVFTSTIGAVDRTKKDNCSKPLDEQSTPNPLTDYGKSKLVCEQHLAASTLPYTIIRPTLVYGPAMRRQSHLRVFIDAVANRKPFVRFNFPGKVSLIQVHDLVEALILVSEHPNAVRQTYFAADDEPVALGTIFQELGSILGSPSGTINVGMGVPQVLRATRAFQPLQLQNLYSDVLTASNAKLRELGFRPGKNRRNAFLETAHNHFSQTGESKGMAVVTGGAGGIGRSITEQLYARGYDVTIVDRDDEQGKVVADLLHGTFVRADLSSVKDIDRVQAYLAEHHDRVSVLVNNAGIGKRGYSETVPPNDVWKIAGVNCIAPVQLSNAVLPAFIQNGKGTLINIGSSAGYQPLPYMAVYAASKAFVIRFTQALQGELAGRGIPPSVEVILASPSGTATNFQKSSGVKDDDAAKLLTPNDVASKILNQIGKGSASIIVGTSGKGMAFAGRIIPTSIQIKLWERLMRSMR